MHGDGPLVSVVIPTYQDQHYLPDALESVGYQTHGHVELILIDSSGIEWIERLATDRDWIRYRSQDPDGLSKARNDAIELARGRYIALLDADDYWHPEKLERQLTALDSDGGHISYTAYYRLDARDEGETIQINDRTPPRPDRAWHDRLRAEIIAIPSTIVFRRSAVPDRPFEESLEACEDIAFLIERFIEETPVHISDPLAVKRVRTGAVTDDMEHIYTQKRKAYDHLLSQYRSHLDLQKLLIDRKIWNEKKLGTWYRDNGDPRLAKRCFAEAEFISGTRRLENDDEDGARHHFEKAFDLIHERDERQLHRRIAQEWLASNITLAVRHFIASVLP
jgi:glycosyltransferase involved in cell wall biosynthesis